MSEDKPRFLLEEDSEAVKYLFGEAPKEDPSFFASIGKSNPEIVAERIIAPAKRDEPKFPSKKTERDVITFTPSRPKGRFTRFLREKTAVIVVSLVSLGVLAGIAFTVYAVISNYMT